MMLIKLLSERQKRLGIIPPDAELTEFDLFLAQYVSEAKTASFARQMEVPAGSRKMRTGMLAGCWTRSRFAARDNHVGVLLSGATMVSMEGTNTGSFNEMTFHLAWTGMPMKRRTKTN